MFQTQAIKTLSACNTAMGALRDGIRQIVESDIPPYISAAAIAAKDELMEASLDDIKESMEAAWEIAFTSPYDRLQYINLEKNSLLWESLIMKEFARNGYPIDAPIIACEVRFNAGDEIVHLATNGCSVVDAYRKRCGGETKPVYQVRAVWIIHNGVQCYVPISDDEMDAELRLAAEITTLPWEPLTGSVMILDGHRYAHDYPVPMPNTSSVNPVQCRLLNSSGDFTWYNGFVPQTSGRLDIVQLRAITGLDIESIAVDNDYPRMALVSTIRIKVKGQDEVTTRHYLNSCRGTGLDPSIFNNYVIVGFNGN